MTTKEGGEAMKSAIGQQSRSVGLALCLLLSLNKVIDTRQFSRPLYHRNIGGHRLPSQSYRPHCISANTIRCIPKQEGDNFCEPK